MRCIRYTKQQKNSAHAALKSFPGTAATQHSKTRAHIARRTVDYEPLDIIFTAVADAAIAAGHRCRPQIVSDVCVRDFGILPLI